MASWVLAHPPWHALTRVRLRWDVLVRSGAWSGRQFLNTPPAATETPAMLQVKAYPYPAKAPDASLFEEVTDEYHNAAGGSEAHAQLYPADSVAIHPSTMLKDLVKAQRYQDAAKVHAELLDMGVEIAQHPAYHFAALHALRDTTLSQRQRADTFTKWWSLFPTRDKVSGHRSVKSVMYKLLRDTAVPDIPLLVRFALLAASKGYARMVAKDAILAIVRYAPMEVSLQFLEQFCAAARNYEMSLVQEGRPAEHIEAVLSRYYEAWYSTAIHEFAVTQRAQVALDLLRLARSRDIAVTRTVYDTLDYRLRVESNSEAIAVLESLRQVGAGYPEWLEPPSQANPSRTPNDHSVPRPSQFPARRDRVARSSSSRTSIQDAPRIELSPRRLRALTDTARSLKRSLKSGHLVMPAKDLAALMSAYINAGRTSLIHRLRALAYRHDHLISLWALAEMMCRRSRNHTLARIMGVYLAHFHLIGVPRSIPEVREDLRRDQITQWRPSIGRKWMPSRQVTHFVWSLFLERARTRSQVQRLYTQFLEDVAASRGISATSVPFIASQTAWAPSTDPEEFHPIPPPSMFDSAHFAIFMEAFIRFELPGRAWRAVVDMYTLGIKPDDRVWEPFLSSLRSLPADRPLTAVLNSVEQFIDPPERSDERSKPAQGDIHRQRDSDDADAHPLKTEMRIFLYTGVMQRMLLDGREAEAVEVAKRFMAKVPYREGTDARADQVLRKIVTVIHNSRTPQPRTPAATPGSRT